MARFSVFPRFQSVMSLHLYKINSPGSEAYWIQALKSMNTVLNTNPTGFWIDMNENSNFIAGERHINGRCYYFLIK